MGQLYLGFPFQHKQLRFGLSSLGPSMVRTWSCTGKMFSPTHCRNSCAVWQVRFHRNDPFACQTQRLKVSTRWNFKALHNSISVSKSLSKCLWAQLHFSEEQNFIEVVHTQNRQPNLNIHVVFQKTYCGTIIYYCWYSLHKLRISHITVLFTITPTAP